MIALERIAYAIEIGGDGSEAIDRSSAISKNDVHNFLYWVDALSKSEFSANGRVSIRLFSNYYSDNVVSLASIFCNIPIIDYNYSDSM